MVDLDCLAMDFIATGIMHDTIRRDMNACGIVDFDAIVSRALEIREKLTEQQCRVISADICRFAQGRFSAALQENASKKGEELNTSLSSSERRRYRAGVACHLVKIGDVYMEMNAGVESKGVRNDVLAYVPADNVEE